MLHITAVAGVGEAQVRGRGGVVRAVALEGLEVAVAVVGDGLLRPRAEGRGGGADPLPHEQGAPEAIVEGDVLAVGGRVYRRAGARQDPVAG